MPCVVLHTFVCVFVCCARVCICVSVCSYVCSDESAVLARYFHLLAPGSENVAKPGEHMQHTTTSTHTHNTHTNSQSLLLIACPHTFTLMHAYHSLSTHSLSSLSLTHSVSLIHLLANTHSPLTHSPLTHPPTVSFIHSLTDPLTHTHTCTHTHTLSLSFTHSLTRPLSSAVVMFDQHRVSLYRWTVGEGDGKVFSRKASKLKGVCMHTRTQKHIHSQTTSHTCTHVRAFTHAGTRAQLTLTRAHAYTYTCVPSRTLFTHTH